MSSPRKRLSTFVSTGRDRFSDKLSRRGLEGHSRHRALLIGINYKNKQDDNYRTLRACTNDAKRIKDLLIGMGWTEHEITMMSDDLPSTSPLYPTKKKMKKQMKKFGQKARKGDNLFLYYAGHSGQVQATSDSDESDHCDEHLVSSDLKIILDNDVKIMLVDRLPAGCRLTAIFDACHSGTIMDLKDKHEPTSRSHTLDSRLANNSGANGPVRTAINRIPRRMASLPISAFAPIRTVAVNTSKYAVGKSKQILGIRRASNPQDREQEQNDTPAIPVQDINIQVQLSPIAEDGQQSYPWSPPQESNSRDHPVPSSAAKKDNMKHPRSLYKRRPREQTPTSPKSDGPVVICLSASWDSQQAYERKTGAIMTEHLLDLLGNNKKATVGEVSEALELRMFKADLRRLFQPKRQKEKSRIKHQTQQSAHAPVLDERPLSDEEARLQFIAQWQRPTITFQNSNADEIAHLPLFVERG